MSTRKMKGKDWDPWEFGDSDEAVCVVFPGIKNSKNGPRAMWMGFVVAFKGEEWGMFGTWGWGPNNLNQEILHHSGDWIYGERKEFVLWPRVQNLVPEWFSEEFATAKSKTILAGDFVVANRFHPNEIKVGRWNFGYRIDVPIGEEFEERLKKLYMKLPRASVSDARDVVEEMKRCLPTGDRILKWGLNAAQKEDLKKRQFGWLALDSERLSRAEASIESTLRRTRGASFAKGDAMTEHSRILRSVWDAENEERNRLLKIKKKHVRRKPRLGKPNFFSMVNATQQLTTLHNEI
jgi:hypothetical protein